MPPQDGQRFSLATTEANGASGIGIDGISVTEEIFSCSDTAAVDVRN